jgi:hypothetical protein
MSRWDRLWHWVYDRTRNPPRTLYERALHKLFEFMEDVDLDGRR